MEEDAEWFARYGEVGRASERVIETPKEGGRDLDRRGDRTGVGKQRLGDRNPQSRTETHTRTHTHTRVGRRGRDLGDFRDCDLPPFSFLSTLDLSPWR